MLEKLDKIAPYLAVAAMSYLAYSATDVAAVRRAQGKDAPPITQEMLRPAFVLPQDHGSPVERDPFEVEWASYRRGTGPAAPAGRARSASSASPSAAAPQAADSTSRPVAQSQAASSPASGPAIAAAPETPPLPKDLGGLVIGEGFCGAIIDERIYKLGETIQGLDPSRCWVVESIESDAVVLQFGEVRQRLVMPAETRAAGKGPASPEARPAPKAPSANPTAPKPPAPVRKTTP